MLIAIFAKAHVLKPSYSHLTYVLVTAILWLGLTSTHAFSQDQRTLQAIRHAYEDNNTRIVLELSGKSFAETLDQPICNYFTLLRPNRYVLDCKGIKIAKNVHRTKTLINSANENPIVSKIRIGAFDSQKTRFVIDLKRPVKPSGVFFLQSKGEGTDVKTRLVIDLKFISAVEYAKSVNRSFAVPPPKSFVPQSTNPKTTAEDSTKSTKKSDLENSEAARALALQAIKTFVFGGDTTKAEDSETHKDTKPHKDESKIAAIPQQNTQAAPSQPQYVILIDPGHGGRDPGAIGPNKIYEKNITLAMALALKDELLKRKGFKVHLTREDNSSVSLAQRRNAAHEKGADIFISLHADALPEGQQKVRGASVHILSEKGSDALSDALASRENKADVQIDLDLSEETEEVASILVSLTSRETQNRSRLLAEQIVKDLRKDVRVMKKPVRRAAFKVLKSLDIPSALIEMGFMTNPDDLKNFRSTAFKAKFVKRLADAIETYFTKSARANGY